MDESKFKTLITERRNEILALNQSASKGTETVELDQTRVGRLSRMDALQQQQMNLESERRRQRELLALDAALKRIEQGEFGHCVACDEEISPARLEIDLIATLCINCASKNERNR